MDKLDKYITEFSSPEDALLRELDRETHLLVVQPRMVSGPVQGKLLELITRMIRPSKVLEIGTFTGYSALCIAAGLEPGATLDTVEINDELEDIARGFFQKSDHGSKIRQHIGSALEVAPQLGRVYDMVFIDGDKREYPEYYRMLMGYAGEKALVRPGSILLADNILWYGKVADEIPANDRYTQGIVEFNRIVREDPRVENVILPVRDGINLIRVK